MLYIGFLSWVLHGLKRSVPPLSAVKHIPEAISVIIAAKNEAKNLPALLTSIAQLEDPGCHYEVIIVNDHSTDESAEILSNWDGQLGIKVIDWSGAIDGLAGKKAAVQCGINTAKYEILAFTDADCQLPPTWLREISRVFTPEIDYMLGYSLILRQLGDSEIRMRNFERSIYYTLAAAGLYWQTSITASACNMMYRKSLFQKCGGFEGIGHIASGDDDLLQMKMMPFMRKGIYNPSLDMQIKSYESKNVAIDHHRNIRRASKFRHHPLYLKLISASVFIYFAMFYLSIGFVIFGKGTALLIAAIIAKSIAELVLSHSHLKMVGHSDIGILYFVQIIVFPLQFIFYAIRGTIGKYKWK